MGEEAGMGIIGAGLNTGVFNRLEDAAAYSQFTKKSDYSENTAKRMTEFNRKQQMKMWEDTNYAAQVEQLDKAGMSVGNLYGKGGGGGATAQVATATAPNPSTPQRDAHMEGMGMLALQQKQVDSNVALNESLADKAKAEADATRGYKADEADAGIRDTNASAGLKEVALEVAKDTQVDKTLEIQAAAREAVAKQESAEVAANVDQATQATKIQAIETEAIGLLLRNSLTRAGINKTEEETRAIAVRLAQDWEKLYQSDRSNDINAKRNGIELWKAQAMNKLGVDGLNLAQKKMMLDAAGNILNLRTRSTKTNTTTYDKNGDYNGERTTETQTH